LVALQHAGFSRVKNYDASMGEWLNTDDEEEVGTVVVKGDK
jgi:3-mercaptopyruvate sulfurtransferase SseA